MSPPSSARPSAVKFKGLEKIMKVAAAVSELELLIGSGHCSCECSTKELGLSWLRSAA